MLKTKLSSQIVNICSLVHVPEKFVDEVEKLFFEFLWGKGKRPKIKRDVIVNDIADGGIRMIDFKNMVKALKISWVKRLLSSDNEVLKPIWKILALNMTGMGNISKLTHKLNSGLIPENIPKFYKQLLESWFDFFSVEPTSAEEILNENLLFNRFILIQGQPISENFNLIKKSGINKISHLIEGNTFKTLR